MAEKTSFDMVVIGGGPGGYVAAIRAAQHRMNVALVEDKHLGGVCLNWGCIPTKALLRSAEVYDTINKSNEFGIEVNGLSFDIKKMVERSRSIAEKLSSGIEHLLKKNRVTVMEGRGRLAGQRRVAVEKDGREIAELSSPHIILATGARARIPPGMEGERVWSYRDALTVDEIPGSLVVVGSGAIGVEFASFFSALGTKVTIIEMLDRILPQEDEEISAFADKSFTGQGMTILTSSTVGKLKKNADGLTVTVERNGESDEVNVDKVLLATGIVANIENLGLEDADIRVERGHVVTDAWCRTSREGVYAIGDLTAPPWLAHKASHEAMICVDKIAGIKDVRPLDVNRIPACTYSRPQIASLGLSEKDALEKGMSIRVGRFPYAANGKAMALGETEGLVKTIFDAETGELLGAHMIGAEASELIHGFTVAMNLETTEAELMATVFPHPTLSETIHESVLDAYHRAIHF